MTAKKADIIDNTIIEGCKKSDPRCQRLLYDYSVIRLYNVAYRIVLDSNKTQDVLQESFIKIFSKISQFDANKGSIDHWMSKIVINQSINYLRSCNKFFEDVTTLEIIEKEFNAIDSLDAEYILDLLKQLPEQQCIIFNLHEIEGFSHEEIGALLNININSSRVYLSRAKSKMQELIYSHNLLTTKTKS